MIASLRGYLAGKSPQAVVVDVGGVGYEVFIPLSTFPRLPDLQKPVIFHTHTHVREDTLQLYGFLSREERDFFLLLLSVSGVGPKVALNILSGLPLDDLSRAVETEDVARLKAVPGVGAKTAGRVILELKGKVAPFYTDSAMRPGGEIRNHEDALSALMNLGYPRNVAGEAINKVCKREEEQALSLEDVIREALRVLMR
jgi:Holliday junction DNA helicase RuvA